MYIERTRPWNIKILQILSSHLILLPEFYTWLTPPGPYRATTCWGRELKFGSYTYFFDHTKTWRASPDKGSAQCRGHLPRQHKHERLYTSFTHPFIRTRWIWKDDYVGQMIFGDLVGLTPPKFVLQVKKTPEKILLRKLVPTGVQTRALLRVRRARYRLLHSGGHVKKNYIHIHLKYYFIWLRNMGDKKKRGKEFNFLWRMML